jgi:2-keto-4-pentenoate hydratase
MNSQWLFLKKTALPASLLLLVASSCTCPCKLSTDKIGKFEKQVAHLSAVRQGKTSVPLSTQFGELSIADAYAIQDASTRLANRKGDATVGYKVAFTSKPSQEMFGVTSPAYGRLFRSMERPDNGTLKQNEFVFFHIEPEVAFKLKRDITTKSESIEQLLPFVASVHAAFDIPDIRFKFEGKPNVADIIADAAAAHRFILGAPHDPSKIDMNKVNASFSVNGKEVSKAPASAALGNPWNVLLWLANLQIERGQPLRKGEVILTGALPKPYKAKGATAVGTYEADLGPLGKIRCKVVE